MTRESEPDLSTDVPGLPGTAAGADLLGLLSLPLVPAKWLRWAPALALVGGGLVVGEGLHGPLSPLLTLGALAGGLWLWGGRPRHRALPQSNSASQWLERCESLLLQFEALEPQPAQGQPSQAKPDLAQVALGPLSPAKPAPAQVLRQQSLTQLRQRQGDRPLELALVGASLPEPALQEALLQVLRGALPLRLLCSHPLPASSSDWAWPDPFVHSDLLLYHLSLPLQARDLRWLESLPADLPVWLWLDQSFPPQGSQLTDFQAQLPPPLRDRWLTWSGDRPDLVSPSGLQALARYLQLQGTTQLERTQSRCLRDLHGRWQLELEALRRGRWQLLLQRTQWTVAGAVALNPLPSLDVLVLAVANGLMLREMAKLWNCPWSMPQLQASAQELAKAALGLGVVEWSTQALAAVVKLHGATWLVGSALQALSAAYLTRVVGRAMADYLALAVGVPEQELEALLRRQAPLLVARAAEEERLDWQSFLTQATDWLLRQAAPKPAGA